MLGKIIKAAIALAITSTFIGGIVAGSFRTMIGASFWRTVAANTVLIGLNYLTTKGSNNTTARNLSTPQAFTNPIAARNTVYGKTRVGGTIVYRDVTLNTKELRQIIAVAAHEINDIKKIFLNNGNETFELSLTTDFSESSGVYTITNTNFVNSDNDDTYGSGGLVKVIYEKGDQTTVNSAIQTAIGSSTWTNDHKLQGIAYIYISCIFDAEKWKGYPTFSFEIEGKKVYDPRTSTTVYSTNPALIVRDYLKDTAYGFGAFDSEINDDTTGAGFIKAANDCDDDITLTAGTEDRYTLNGEYTASEEPQKVLETMLSSCAGQLTYNNGKFNLFVGKERTASGTITDDKLLAPVQITTKSSATNLVNGVKASYVNPDNRYQATEIRPYQDSTYLTEDTPSGEASANYEKFMNLSFPYTHTTTTAQRLARIALDYARQDQVLSVVVPIEFMTHQVGDIINLTNDRLGYSGKDFEITSMSFEFIEDNYLALRLNLKEYSTTVFDNITYTADPTLPDDLDAGDNTVPVPTGLTLTEITKTPSFGDVAKQFYIRANWTNASDEKIAATEVAYKKSTDTVFVAKSVAYGTTRIIESAESDTTYNFKVRHISAEGVAGDYTSVVNITTSSAQGTHSAGSVGGVTVGTDKLYIGTGTFNNTNTGFYVDDTGQFSLKDKLSWNGTTLNIEGNITADTLDVDGATVTGTLDAASITLNGTPLDDIFAHNSGTGETTITGSESLTGNLSIGGNLTVTGNIETTGHHNKLVFGTYGKGLKFGDSSILYEWTETATGTEDAWFGHSDASGLIGLSGSKPAFYDGSNFNGIAYKNATSGYVVVGTDVDLKFDSIGVGTAASGTTGEIRATNNITAYYSDARLKDFEGVIPNALDKLSTINGYYFKENDKAKELGYNNPNRQVGVSAQEILDIMPEAVTEAPIDKEYLAVQYDKLVPLLIQAIKELKQEVEELKQ